MLPRFPAAFRPPAFAYWASCPARGFRPSHDRPTTPPSARTRTGFPCSARVRPSWGGRPLYPGGGGVPTTVPRSTVAACRFPAASPCHPGVATRPGELVLTGHHQGFTGIRPSSLPLTCGPGTEPAPLGFPEAPHPYGQDPQAHVQGGDKPRTLTRSHVFGNPNLQTD
jgi:hypothetical protein